MKKLQFLIVSITMSLMFTSISATNYYVTSAGVNTNNGLTWASPTTLDAALVLAVDDDVINIGAGTYTPTVAITNGNAATGDVTFEIKKNISVIGGYPTVPTISSVPSSTSITLFDGLLKANHIIAITAPVVSGKKVTLSNLSVTGGKSGYYGASTITINSLGYIRSYGAALVIGASTVELNNCRLYGNQGTNALGAHIFSGANVVFNSCLIENNIGTGNGIGIWNDASTVTINNTTISGNQTTAGNAAGILAVNTTTASKTYMYNSSIINNVASSRTAYYGREKSIGIMVHCTVSGNTTTSVGGAGISLYTGTTGAAANAVKLDIINSTITNNSNIGTELSGGIRLNDQYCTLNIYNSIVSGNTSGAVGSKVVGDIILLNSGTYAKKNTVISDKIYDAIATEVVGSTFNFTSMLEGLSDNGGDTKTCKLLLTDETNPAKTLGMSASELTILGGTLSPIVPESTIAYDQLGNARTGRVIGAWTANGITRSVISVIADNNGSISSGAGTYNSGESVTVIAQPNSGYRFINWTDNGLQVSTTASYTFTVNADRTLTANFASNIVNLTNGTTNASTLLNCSTCDINITGSGTKLIVDENKTFNSLTVAPGAQVTLSNGKTLNPGTFTLQSNTNGTGTFVDTNTPDNLHDITASVQQYVTAGRNWYISSPITDAKSDVFSASNGYPILWYDEAHGSTLPWPVITNTTTALDVMKGYVVNVDANVLTAQNNAVTFTGTLNNGSLPALTLSRTDTQKKAGFNLTGNPYPSYLDWNLATKNNLSGTFWYRTKVGSVYKFFTYNGTISGYGGGEVGSPAGVTNMIPPMQAFWVKVASGTTGSLAFTNAMRDHQYDSGNKFRAPSKNNSTQQLLRLEVSNGINTDETVIYSNPNASNEFDNFDSPKMTNANASIPEIYTLVDSEQLVINGMNNISPNQEIPLGFATGQSNAFSIKAIEMNNIDSNLRMMLNDKALNTETELTKGVDYNFTSDITNTTNRFSIIFRSASVTTGFNTKINNLNVLVYKNAFNQIVINFKGILDSESSVEVYNTVGQKLISKQLKENVTLLDTQLKSGVYYVKILQAGKSITQKVVL